MEKQEENISAEPQKPKSKRIKKKEGRIAKAYRLHQKGVSITDIAKQMKIKENVVRAYCWRMKNPDAYAALLKRYFEKRKAKLASNKQSPEV